MLSCPESNSGILSCYAVMFWDMVRGNFFYFSSFIFLFFWIPSISLSQLTKTGHVSGIVYDETTRKPLPDANIYLVQLKSEPPQDWMEVFQLKMFRKEIIT